MLRSFLVDTNVLLQLANPALKLHRLCKDVLFSLAKEDVPLHYTLQNATAFGMFRHGLLIVTVMDVPSPKQSVAGLKWRK